MQIWPGRKLASLPKPGQGVLDFHKDERATMEKFRQEIRLAIEKDRAEVIILGMQHAVWVLQGTSAGIWRSSDRLHDRQPEAGGISAGTRKRRGGTSAEEDCTKGPDPEEMRGDWQLTSVFNLEGLLD